MPENQFPLRKHPRLKNFNYDCTGAYFVTICIEGRKPLLSRINHNSIPDLVVSLELLPLGKIVEEELLNIKNRFPCITVEHYVIMPNHLHVIFTYNEGTAGASPRPTLMDAICAFKSVATKRCKEVLPLKKLFQTSFYEHVIHNSIDHQNHVRYIFENPKKWKEDELFSE